MSLRPTLRVILNKKTKDEDCKKIREEISKVKGVFRTHFNEKAKEVVVTYSGSQQVKQDIAKIKGVDGIRHQL